MGPPDLRSPMSEVARPVEPSQSGEQPSAEARQGGQQPSAEAGQGGQEPSPNLDRLLKAPLRSPQVRVLPWWFPVEEMRQPIVFYLETWVVEEILGANQSTINELEWLSQALLHVTKLPCGTVAEITIFGRPRDQNLLKGFLLSLAVWYKELKVKRAERMQQLEEFLKNHE
ncbi:oocyte-expressed protein homolog [Dipodomys merriami]|uniref:oocyte-expressed protein homolog n=1 Tax=Dipodomys merriami TaxID=94247 RepID=UPI00385595E1